MCSASVGQKENRGAGLQPKVKELEKQLNDQRVTSARRESLLKAQLKVLLPSSVVAEPCLWHQLVRVRPSCMWIKMQG